MAHESFFADEASESVFSAGEMPSAEPASATFTAPEAVLRALIEAAQVVVPEGAHVVHVKVTPGEVVELPFGPEAHFLARLGDGNLAIKVGDVTVILQGYADASTDPQHPVIVESADGHPLDIATLLASTDPTLDIQTAAGPGGNGGGQGADNTGAILQQFGAGEGGLGGFEGAGAQGDSSGPNGGAGPDTNGVNNPSAINGATGPVNVAPVAADLAVTTNEDTKFTGTLPATDANGDPLTYSVVGALPKYVTVNPDGSWSFDPSTHFDALDTGDHDTVTFQYKANDGTADSNIGTVTIDLTGVNDPPQWTSGTIAVGFEENDVGELRGLIFGITDPDDGVFTITLQSPLPAGFTFTSTGVTQFITGTPDGLYDSLKVGEEKDFNLTFGISDGEATTTHDIRLEIFGINDAPVIGGTATPLAYTENDAATPIAASATVSDVDSANFNGGSLTVALGATGHAEDQLSILNQGTGPGQIGISGADVTYGGTTIGTWSGGANGADLIITFTSDAATPAAAQALLRDIAYANSSDNPSGADRAVHFTLVDGDGTAAAGTDTGTADATIHVTPVDDAPIAHDVHFVSSTEETNGGGIDISSFAITDPDSATFTFRAVTAVPAGVTLDSDGHVHLDLAGHYDYLAAGDKTTVSFDYVINDGQLDSAPAPITVEVNGVNDAPVIGGTATPLGYTENDAPTAIAASATVSDIDSPNFNGGSLTVSLGATGLAEDQLSILNQGTGAGQIGISGSDVTYGGAKIGTWSGGANGADLVITFNSDTATVAATQALLRDIAYANSSDNPSAADRTAHFTLVDGDGTNLGGTDTGTADATIHVTPVNDAPVVPPVITAAIVDQNGTRLPLPEDFVSVFGSVSPLAHDAETPSNLLTFINVSAMPPGFTFTSDGVTHANLAGHYDYLPEGQIIPFSFTYHAFDGQAFSNVGIVSGTIIGVNDAPTAIGETIITNDSTFAVPQWALLANDQDPDNPTLSVHVTTLSGLTHIDNPPGSDVSVFDDATPGGSFTYKASDGSLDSADTAVSIVHQAGFILTGTAAHEIVVASPSGEFIDGHGGNDLIFAGDGDDTVFYHQGDRVDGGGDNLVTNAIVGFRGDVLISGDDLDLNAASNAFVDKTGHDQHTFTGIETVSLLNAESGAVGNQTLMIDAAGVLAASDAKLGNLPFGELTTIRIDANPGDHLYLSVSADTNPGGTWTDLGALADHEVYAHSYSNGVGDAYVLAARNMQVTLNQDAPTP